MVFVILYKGTWYCCNYLIITVLRHNQNLNVEILPSNFIYFEFYFIGVTIENWNKKNFNRELLHNISI